MFLNVSRRNVLDACLFLISSVPLEKQTSDCDFAHLHSQTDVIIIQGCLRTCLSSQLFSFFSAAKEAMQLLVTYSFRMCDWNVFFWTQLKCFQALLMHLLKVFWKSLCSCNVLFAIYFFFLQTAVHNVFMWAFSQRAWWSLTKLFVLK